MKYIIIIITLIFVVFGCRTKKTKPKQTLDLKFFSVKSTQIEGVVYKIDSISNYYYLFYLKDTIGNKYKIYSTNNDCSSKFNTIVTKGKKYKLSCVKVNNRRTNVNGRPVVSYLKFKSCLYEGSMVCSENGIELYSTTSICGKYLLQ